MPDYKRIMKQKKRQKKSIQEFANPKRALGLGKVIFALVLCALIVALILGMRVLLINLSDFKIKKVSIINEKGRELANPEDFFRLDLVDNLNLFSFDMQRIAQDIQARHPELLAVSVHKRFPNKLLIKVVEKEPQAIVVLPDSCLVDVQGFTLPYKPGYKDLPKIFGIHPRQVQLYTQSSSLRLQKALNLLAELKKAKIHPEYQISKIDVRQYQDIIFYFRNGIEVKMGESDFARKVALLSKILLQLKTKGTVPKYIDMRFDNPAVLP